MRKLTTIALGVLVLILCACGKGVTVQLPGSGPSSSSSGASMPSANAIGSTPAIGSSSTGSAGNAGLSNAQTPIERVVQQLQPSVVRVDVSAASSRSGPFGQAGGGQAAQSSGTGTGMVLDAQGHIVTNNHVVTPDGGSTAQSLTVDLPNGKSMPGRWSEPTLRQIWRSCRSAAVTAMD